MSPRDIAFAVCLFASGCASANAPTPVTASLSACAVGDAMVETQLFFGLSKPSGGTVGPREWEAFVAREIAPRLPEGFTVLDGAGFWRDAATAKTISEKSKVVVRLRPPGAEADATLDAIAAAYKKAFAQDSVLRIDRPVCARF